ncbi:MAG TPA: DUF4331 domain-containing protein [Marmoricola sp.]|nr:DUF4331 domain-containing protein [Marmoricola sp.]
MTPRRKAVAVMAAGGLIAGAGLAGLGPVGAQASSHREAPLIAGMPQYDTTDVYAFRSPERAHTVTLIANWLPNQEPAGGPNFYPFATDARYDIHVDNDGDARPDVTFRWTFRDHYRSKNTFLYNTGPVTFLRDKNLNFYQTYRLVAMAKGHTKVLVRNGRVAPSRVGDASMPNYGRLRDQAVTDVAVGRHRFKSFAGQADDPFFLDLRVFDLLYGGDLSEVGDDTLTGFNVNSVALQVPRRFLAKGWSVERNPVIGTWSTTSERGVNGKFHQVSRLGNPLVNEVVIPLKDKNRFNASSPRRDAQFLDYVTKPELPQLIEAIYGIEAPEEPRDDLVSVFLTGVEGLNQPAHVRPSEQLRLNMSTPLAEDPNRLGVIGGDTQGYPNGRRLADDVIDISLQVVEGELVGNPNDLSDKVDANEYAFGDSFPYLALPTSGSNPDPHPSGMVDMDASSASTDGNQPLVPAAALGLGLLALASGAVRLTQLRNPRRSVVS